MITLVLGGVRSGKSHVAERLAAEYGLHVTYVATGGAADPDMAARIALHKARRDPSWATVECGKDLPRVVASTPGVALVDSLGTWVAGHDDLDADIDGLLSALEARTQPCVLVSDEVGLSVHPTTPLGRQFQDTLGFLNRSVADVADRALLVVAGRALELPPC